MSEDWGNRSFDVQEKEEYPCTDRHNTGRRRQPQFHEVFGSRNHRRGQLRGRARGSRGGFSRKRPAFEEGESEGRKRRKYVPGGMIPKFKRIQEYEGDTYCGICRKNFRDVATKIAHDRSHDHRRTSAHTRHQEEEDQGIERESSTSTRQESEEDRRKNLQESVAAFIKMDVNTLPKQFREWMEKSLATARQAAEESKDPHLLQAVRREVAEVYRVNDKDCSLRRIVWARKPLASGKAYRDRQPTSTLLPAIPYSVVSIGYGTTSKKEELPAMPKKEEDII